MLISTPIIRTLAERATRWRLWDDKARYQVRTSRLQPSLHATTRANTTVIDHLVHAHANAEAPNPAVEEWYSRVAQLLLQAGANNFAVTVATTLFYLLNDRTRLEKLREEVAVAFEGAGFDGREPSWKELEKGHYAAACVKEGLRLAMGSLIRLGRISPDVDLVVDGRLIKKGTPISMTTYFMHRDPTVFPSPSSFIPERWLTADPAALKLMNEYYVPFGKGSRSCIAPNLVKMTLHFTLAHLFRPGAPDLELFNTSVEDVEPVHGYFAQLPRDGSKGVRVLVR